ncbi:MAG: phosphoribosylglycinamide formyltransferase [Paracoccaceae bacterium]
MRRIAVLISGGGSNMVALARDLAGSDLGRVVLVLSNVPGAGGLDKAASMGIGTAVVDHRGFGSGRAGFEAALQAELLRAGVDLVCLAGFMRVLSAGFVRAWAGRMLNIHPSLLPRYPGLHTHARALAAGDAEAGCTVHLVTEELDGGPILGQARVPVRPQDSAATLAARVLEQEHRLYPAVLRRVLAGDLTRHDT